MTNKSGLAYRRLHEVRDRGPFLGRASFRTLPETAHPRYGKKTVLSHRRGEKGMRHWLRHV
jgi:hypothetical protein